MIKIAFCDDDTAFLSLISEKMKRLLAESGVDASQTTYSDPRKLVKDIQKGSNLFHVFFVDLHMDRMHGFEVAEEINRYYSDRTLIFVTSLENSVKEGYKYNAFRFVFKSRLEEDLAELLPHLLRLYSDRINLIERVELKILAEEGYENIYENVWFDKRDILYLEYGTRRRTRVVTVDGEYPLLVKPLKEYLTMIDSSDFYIILRCYIINLYQVRKVTDTKFVFWNGKTLPLGASRLTRTQNRALFLKYIHERVL